MSQFSAYEALAKYCKFVKGQTSLQEGTHVFQNIDDSYLRGKIFLVAELDLLFY